MWSSRSWAETQHSWPAASKTQTADSKLLYSQLGKVKVKVFGWICRERERPWQPSRHPPVRMAADQNCLLRVDEASFNLIPNFFWKSSSFKFYKQEKNETCNWRQMKTVYEMLGWRRGGRERQNDRCSTRWATLEILLLTRLAKDFISTSPQRKRDRKSIYSSDQMSSSLQNQLPCTTESFLSADATCQKDNLIREGLQHKPLRALTALRIVRF